MTRATAWVLAATLSSAALMVVPSVLEALRPPAAREAWRRDILLIGPEEAGRAMVEGDRKILVLDTREAEEFAECHIPFARHVPLRDVRTMDLSACREADLVIPYCLKDLRGFEAARILKARGIEQVALFKGFGLNAWETAGLPLAGTWTSQDDAKAALDLRELTGRSGLGGGR